jgi:hypothetical protein
LNVLFGRKVSQGFLLDKEEDIYEVVARMRVLRGIIDKNINAAQS